MSASTTIIDCTERSVTDRTGIADGTRVNRNAEPLRIKQGPAASPAPAVTPANCHTCYQPLGAHVYIAWHSGQQCRSCYDADDYNVTRIGRGDLRESICRHCARVVHSTSGQWRSCTVACQERHRRARRRLGRPCATCATCTAPMTPARSDSRYCSNACRQRAYRRRAKGAQQ
jgi:hypothetical protein